MVLLYNFVILQLLNLLVDELLICLCVGVTLFYKRTGEEAVRMAQISCESGLESTASNTISDKLLTLEHR